MIELLAAMVGAALTLVGLILVFPILGLWLWMLARICRKAGFSGWWCLATLFPPLLIVMVWVLAFADWPGAARRVEIYPPQRPY